MGILARLAVATGVLTSLSYGGDWNPRLAAEYLDGRQKEWFAWPAATSSGVPCISCHTGLPYMLARPALRRALGESGPTIYEKGLLDAVRSRIGKTTPQEMYPKNKEPYASRASGVETVLAALLLAKEESGQSQLSPAAEKAFDRLWALRISSGERKGIWAWHELNLDPWETPDSAFFGATLAAMAVGVTPASYRTRPDVQANLQDLAAYLRDQQASQPLHNRLLLLWASQEAGHILPEPTRQDILQEIWRRQQPDGGWTIAALGNWKEHPAATPGAGSNGYATGLTAFLVQQAGVNRSDPRLAKALNWLRAHQSRETGAWDANSMNKQYPPDSMQVRFMQDAATGYAVLALLSANPTSHE